MSSEQLLFLLLLVAIPLLERLIRALRARTGGLPGERTAASAEATVLRPRSPVSVPGAGAAASEGRGTELLLPTLPLPPALPQAVAGATPVQLHASERETRVRPDRKHAPAKSLRAGHSDRPIALRRVVAGADLRRAIVLIAILGPCRALEPKKDASQLGQ
jgi:hypothetical protein